MTRSATFAVMLAAAIGLVACAKPAQDSAADPANGPDEIGNAAAASAAASDTVDQ
jgi:ABC-type glycerol-3-phosphate transport system substrate-binding protein